MRCRLRVRLSPAALPVIEVTLRTKAALDAIRAIAAEVPDCVVGVGTVTRPADITAAIAAGAKYLVSPGTPAELAAALADASVPVLPGCATVSEAMALAARGFKVLKFFPAEASGGVAWLKSVAAPLPDLKFCPTGGIDGRNIADLSRLSERARGRRLVGRAEGCDRVWRLRPHHAACARGIRVARQRRMTPVRRAAPRVRLVGRCHRHARHRFGDLCLPARGAGALPCDLHRRHRACSARCCRRCWPAA